MTFTFSHVQAHINTVYVLVTKDDRKSTTQSWRDLHEHCLRLKVDESNILSNQLLE
jgi:hypothetical protein